MAFLKLGKWSLPAFGVTVVLGILLAIQFETQQRVIMAKAANDEKAAAIQKYADKAAAEKSQLLAENKRLQTQVDAYRNRPGEVSPEVKRQIAKVGILTGQTAVQGSGIHIEIDDRKVTEPDFNVLEYLQRIVNWLKYAKSEAIEVNGQRIGPRTVLVASGPTNILVNGVPISRINGAYWEVEAIGNQDTLKNYIQTLAVDDYKQFYPELNVTIMEKEVEIPSLKGLADFTIAKQVN